MLYIDYLSTPIGVLEIIASDKVLTSVVFVDKEAERVSNSITDTCKQQLSEYFEGKRTRFDVPLDQAGTDFQEQVWKALLDIEFGKTVSYKEVASAINKPKAVRAVGSANGRNKLFILIPCHRVIASNKQLSGYAGGVERKAWLLKHEKEVL